MALWFDTSYFSSRNVHSTSFFCPLFCLTKKPYSKTAIYVFPFLFTGTSVQREFKPKRVDLMNSIWIIDPERDMFYVYIWSILFVIASEAFKCNSILSLCMFCEPLCWNLLELTSQSQLNYFRSIDKTSFFCLSSVCDTIETKDDAQCLSISGDRAEW